MPAQIAVGGRGLGDARLPWPAIEVFQPLAGMITLVADENAGLFLAWSKADRAKVGVEVRIPSPAPKFSMTRVSYARGSERTSRDWLLWGVRGVNRRHPTANSLSSSLDSLSSEHRVGGISLRAQFGRKILSRTREDID
jgi:hypothetical protein